MCLSGRLGEANLSACSVAEIVPCNTARQSLLKLVRRYFLPASFASSSSDWTHERWYLFVTSVLFRILYEFCGVPHYRQIIAEMVL
jgi:hypothetical protein